MSLQPTEKVLVERILKRIQAGDLGKDVEVAVEVRSHGRAKTDVAILKAGQLTAIEVKKSNWQRAILQAVLNRCFADYSYIALWSSGIRVEVEQNAIRWGLGILRISEEGVEVHTPAQELDPDPELRETVVHRLRQESDK